MPWEVKQDGDNYCVFKKGGGKVKCHGTRAQAIAQMRALYANEGKTFSELDSIIQVKNFADLVAEAGAGVPVWIQAFPFGHWPHPGYTDTTITYDRAERMVKNFKENVRRQQIATDFEHGFDSNKGSKASGWIKDVELRADGLYYLVDWTPTARKEIAEGEWKYFSGAMLDAWHDDETDEVFEDVIIGGGLTNAPWMKDRVPLNFSEVVATSNDSGKRFKVSETATGDKAVAIKTFLVSEDGGNTWRVPVKDEVAEWEHSEPGTGSPPPPRTDEDDRSGDKDDSGSRRDTPPPQDNATITKEGSKVKLTKEALKALGLPEDTEDVTEDDLNAAVVKVFSESAGKVTTLESELKSTKDELEPLKVAEAARQTEKTFAEQYPEQHKELELARIERVANKAKTFSESFERIRIGEGETATRSTRGPSALALDKMREAHTAIMLGKTEDGIKAFSETLEIVLSDKGIVDYGEKGSTRTGEKDDIVPTDQKEAAKVFSEACNAAIVEAGGSSKMSWGDAVSKVATDKPELYRAYRGEEAVS